MKNRCVALWLGLVSIVGAVPAGAEQEESLATADLADLDRKLNNPLTSTWSLTFQNNSSANTGDAVAGTEY